MGCKFHYYKKKLLAQKIKEEVIPRIYLKNHLTHLCPNNQLVKEASIRHYHLKINRNNNNSSHNNNKQGNNNLKKGIKIGRAHV